MFIGVIACSGFFLLYIGTTIQIWRIVSRRDSISISLWEIFLRLLASLLLLVKMIAIGDIELMTGQTVWVMLYISYITVVIFYKYNRKFS